MVSRPDHHDVVRPHTHLVITSLKHVRMYSCKGLQDVVMSCAAYTMYHSIVLRNNSVRSYE